MKSYKCQDGCCTIKIKRYLPPKFNRKRRNYKKAGAFIYDPGKDRVLLVQSRGHLWGPPKGTLNFKESEKEGAIREVFEETGLDISKKTFSKATVINNQSIYYYLEMNLQDSKINIQQDINKNEVNDANGISWIKVNCLKKCILNGNMVLNHYAKIVFFRFLNIEFPRTKWILVSRKKSRKK